MIRLEPMDGAMFEVWREASIRDYAREKVEAGNWLADDALERAAADFAALLPDGRATAGHEVQSMVDAVGERVGYVWFAIEERPFGRVVFIYDIAVDPAHRRKGHAQAALAAIEAFARANGCVGVQLHVFGDNAGARALYQRAGYVETNVTMLKRVDR
jgi:ribosomal protein S18 acetylase RimI-like enzyme